MREVCGAGEQAQKNVQKSKLIDCAVNFNTFGSIKPVHGFCRYKPQYLVEEKLKIKKGKHFSFGFLLWLCLWECLKEIMGIIRRKLNL